MRHFGGVFIFALSEAKSGLLSSADGLLARAARDFSRILTLWHLKTQNFARPQGRPSKDGKDWLLAL